MTLALSESTPPGLEGLLRLAPISLSDNESATALNERHDRKYLVEPDDVDEILSGLGTGFRILEVGGLRSFRYESVYFDTPEIDSYFDAARQRPYRFKVRTRSYLDSQLCYLEVKERRRDGLTIKQRFPYPFEHRRWITADGRTLLRDSTSVASHIESLQPTLTVHYTRSTLIDTGAQSRATIDTGINATRFDGPTVTAEGFTLIESKSQQHATPFDHLLWRHHYRPTAISKYCTLMAAIDPTLPANKWNPVLNEYFRSPRP